MCRFVWLRPIHRATAKEVIRQLILIFIDFGCPSILHTDNGSEFKNALMDQLDVRIAPPFNDVMRLDFYEVANPSCVVGRSRSRPTESSVERANRALCMAMRGSHRGFCHSHVVPAEGNVEVMQHWRDLSFNDRLQWSTLVHNLSCDEAEASE